MRKRREPIATMVDFFLDADPREVATVYRILGLIVEKRIRQQEPAMLRPPRRSRSHGRKTSELAVVDAPGRDAEE